MSRTRRLAGAALAVCLAAAAVLAGAEWRIARAARGRLFTEPAGVPVATVAVGKAGARNAGILAAQILSGKHPALKKFLLRHKAAMAARVAEQARKVVKSR